MIPLVEARPAAMPKRTEESILDIRMMVIDYGQGMISMKQAKA